MQAQQCLCFTSFDFGQELSGQCDGLNRFQKDSIELKGNGRFFIYAL